MTPHFASLVNPTFHYVLALVERLQRGEAVELKAEQIRIRTLLSEAEGRLARPECPVQPDDFAVAKRGLVYWADEVLTRAQKSWESHVLEWELYGTLDRAWLFYVDGETKALHATADVIEVYYLALALGFEGDLPDAFRRLGRKLPPDTSDEKVRELRGAWAEELARHIPKKRGGGLPPQPVLEGDVAPLTGGSVLSAAIGWTVSLLVVTALLAWWAF